MVQGHIADMALEIDAAALLIYRAAWAKDSRARQAVTREAAMAKLYATDEPRSGHRRRCSCMAATVCGRGSVVESLYREIRALRIYEGASDVQRVVIARQTHGGLSGGRLMMLGPTAYTDTFTRDNLPPRTSGPTSCSTGSTIPNG
jgi:acyl-CoA dehydrogenase